MQSFIKSNARKLFPIKIVERDSRIKRQRSRYKIPSNYPQKYENHFTLIFVHGRQYTCEKSTRIALIHFWNRIKHISGNISSSLWGTSNHIFRVLNVPKRSVMKFRRFCYQVSTFVTSVIFLGKGWRFFPPGRAEIFLWPTFPGYIRGAILNRWKMHARIFNEVGGPLGTCTSSPSPLTSARTGKYVKYRNCLAPERFAYATYFSRQGVTRLRDAIHGGIRIRCIL